MPATDLNSPWWLPGGHAQTVWPLAIPCTAPPYRRERITTSDGDFIDFDWIEGGGPNSPLLVLFHGLEGRSQSHYARSLMHAASARGWRGVVPHFRGCSGEPNRLARAYHSGDSDEIDWILQRCAREAGDAPMFVAGVSLGGNALLKWLGERQTAAKRHVSGAAAVCPPLDLTISGHALGSGFNRLYSWRFLRTLKRKAFAKLERHPGLFDPRRMRNANSLYEFDDLYTGPAHGFAGADDYWRRASSKPYLRQIETPTLLLCALNDPFVPSAALPETADLSPHVQFACPAQGGHVGFLEGSWPGHLSWLPNRLLAHFDQLQ